MINAVIRQIIELDKRAVKIKESSTARAVKIERDTKDELKEEETKIITKAQEESKQNYDVEIKKAQIEKSNAIEAMETTIAAIRDQYEKEKSGHAKAVLEELFTKA